MRNKRFLLLLVLALLAMPLAPSVAQDGDGGCQLDPPDSEVTINLIGWSFPIMDFYAEEVVECDSVDNINVNQQLFDSGTAKEQIRLGLSGGDTAPFEIVHADDALIVELAAEGWLLPLDDLIEKYRDQYELDDIPDSLWASGTIDGKIYGVPIVANTMHLFYRADLLEQYELDVPETYDDVIAACEVLKQDDTILLPFTINLHAGWAWRLEFHNFLKSFGGDWLNEDSTPAFNSPAGVAAVEKMLEVVDACMGEDGLTYSIDDSEIGMETGDLAMVTTWASRAANMYNEDLSFYPDEIEFAPAPRPNPDGGYGGPAAVDFYVIPANTEVDPDLIFQVIMQAAELESQLDAAQFGIVSRAAVAESGAGGRYLPAAAATIADGAGGYGANPAVGLARTAIENNLPRIITDDLTPEQALNAAADEYVEQATAQGYLD